MPWRVAIWYASCSTAFRRLAWERTGTLEEELFTPEHSLEEK
jgi:hypothetical protein